MEQPSSKVTQGAALLVISTLKFYLAGLRKAEREDPTVHGGDESGALCPNTKNHKSDKGTNDLITCTAQ